MRLRTSISAATSLLFFLLLVSCTETEPVEFGEERSRVITSVADNLIIPGYAALDAQLDTLYMAVADAAAAPSTEKYASARARWLTALLAWEQVCLYDFGPAMNAFGSLNTDIATFPASELKIKNAIAASDTSTQNFDRDKRGFFALEYLLFPSDDVSLTHPDSSMRREYAVVVAAHLRTSVHAVRTAWTAYRTDFINSTGTDAGSSMSLLFNAFNMGYEHAKNFKIAVPAGRRLGQPVAPQLVEAYYSKASLIALKKHIRTVYAMWSGSGSVNLGFKYYLGFVPNGDRLIADTEQQMDSLNVVLDSFNDSEVLSDLISASDPRIDKLVEHSQKMSRFYKSELSSLIGIAITYSSGDGD